MYGAMAFVWLSLGAVVIVWGWLHPDQAMWRIRGTDLSIGWLGILLGLYNAVRWWSRRTQAARERTEETSRLEREQRHRDEQRRQAAPYDPTFDFTNPPAPSSGERPG